MRQKQKQTPRSHNQLNRKENNRSRRSTRGRSNNRRALNLSTAIETTEIKISDWLEHPPEAPSKTSSFQLDPWQKEALEALKKGDNVIVDAPTTAGKTRIVEAFFRENLNLPGFKAMYTTPVKSLSNDKLKEFRQMFGSENVGISTGDVKDNTTAPIVIATLESYRNSLLGIEPDLDRSIVIFDEYHFLQDSSRGSAWEEAIILSPPNCQILLLSASVGNPIEFKKWIDKVKDGDCQLIKTTKRPVPLENLVYYKNNWLLTSTIDKSKFSKHSKGSCFPLEHDEIATRVAQLESLDLLPCIVYSAQRLGCENLAKSICRKVSKISIAHSDRILEVLNEIDLENRALSFLPKSLKKMITEYGVGYHHSGLAHPGRMAIETLVKEGLLRFCTATMGLSLGINFSVRSTLISDFRRPGDMGFVGYSASEVLQMTGRAGRRGKDRVGFSLWPSVDYYKELKVDRRESCYSSLKNDPTTFLGLLARGFNLSNIASFYANSFMRFKNKSVDLTLVDLESIEDYLNTAPLPCQSPMHELSKYIKHHSYSSCYDCPSKKRCHRLLKRKAKGNLASLHLHLHNIGAIGEDEKLTQYGSIARFFPQNGGLLLAAMIEEQSLSEENLMAGVELMAALSLARYKEPGVPSDYKFPFNVRKISRRLEDFYPYHLFDDLYDPPFKRRRYPAIRDFNPKAGFIAREWLKGASWEELTKMTTHEKFKEGDLMAVLFRTATYLQSMTGIDLSFLGMCATSIRDELLREPLKPNFSPSE